MIAPVLTATLVLAGCGASTPTAAHPANNATSDDTADARLRSATPVLGQRNDGRGAAVVVEATATGNCGGYDSINDCAAPALDAGTGAVWWEAKNMRPDAVVGDDVITEQSVNDWSTPLVVAAMLGLRRRGRPIPDRSRRRTRKNNGDAAGGPGLLRADPALQALMNQYLTPEGQQLLAHSGTQRLIPNSL
ncbi:MAG TPA: hypothetical protein VGN81_37265 [Pseudonocardiaceae bacterium]